MSTGIFTIASALHDKERINRDSAEFLEGIFEKAGTGFTFCGDDFSRYGEFGVSLIFIQTGGSEEKFRQLYSSLKGPYYLLASGTNNSLAASMEILSYLRVRGEAAEILHGSTEYIAGRISAVSKIRNAKKTLAGSNFGVIGKPSDWLIASAGDYTAINEKIGAKLIDIPMEEFAAEIDRCEYPAEAKSLFAGQYDGETVEKALHIYGALKRLAEKYNLSGMTVRCFDLLGTLRNTSCLGLAILNRDGITAACEGDVPAMMSMAILNALTGRSGFQSNPSSISVERNEIILAHCTVPLDMVESYRLHSHFESGLGVAVRGVIPAGDATVFKVSGDLSRYFVSDAAILKNLCSDHLCRTQIIVKPEKSVQYFLKDSIGNHHIVLRGHHAALLEEFMRSL